jgi:hypothetical protein
MGQTSIKDTILGQSIIGYQLKTKVPYYFYKDGNTNYLSIYNNDKVLLPPLLFRVTNVFMQKGLGDIYLYLEVMLESHHTKALMMIKPEYGCYCDYIERKSKGFDFFDTAYYGTYDVTKPIHIKRNMLEII